MTDTQHCWRCTAPLTDGYAERGAPVGGGQVRICYDCAADYERDHMCLTGRATLYLLGDDSPYRDLAPRWRCRVLGDDKLRVTDWPGRLVFKCSAYRLGRHNIAGRRIDVWFDGPDGHVWHGVNIGDNQVLRCRRTKKLVAAHCDRAAS